MALRPSYVLTAVLLVVALVLMAALWYLTYHEPEPDPFRMTLNVTGTDVNATDANLTDVAIWVAVSSGEPKPPWTDVDVKLESAEGCRTLVPPLLRIEDLDQDGRVTEGDLLFVHALTDVEARGRVVMWQGDRVIGKVEL